MSDFNFESFIAAAAPRTDEVKIYAVDLTDQINKAAEAADSTKGAEKKRLEDERDALIAKMEEAALIVKVKALTSAQLLALRGEEDEVANWALQIHSSAVEPMFTLEQARRIVEDLPSSEAQKIIAASNDLTFTEVKTPDFSHKG